MNRVNDNEQISKIAIFVLLIFLIGTPLLAAPAISGVNGTVSNGQSITISGSGFGSGPNVVVFDDFEKGTNGSNIMTGSGSAAVGKWDALVGTKVPKYSNTNKVSGNLSFKADMSGDWLEYVLVNLPASTTKVFVSYWTLIPSGTAAPGDGNSAGTNWKLAWLQGNSSTDHDWVAFNYLGSLGSALDSNDQNAKGGYGPWISPSFSKGTWYRFWSYIDGTSSGSVAAWDLNSSGVKTLVNQSHSFTWSSAYFQNCRINGYGRQTSNCYPTFDDVYVATGDNALARIEIGNSSTYTSCTKLTICTPSSWTSSSISTKVWKGQFGSSDSAYLFVIDSSGNASSGYPIKFSGSTSTTDTTPPTVPTGVNVQIIQ
jgi:hypothetical protein